MIKEPQFIDLRTGANLDVKAFFYSKFRALQSHRLNSGLLIAKTTIALGSSVAIITSSDLVNKIIVVGVGGFFNIYLIGNDGGALYNYESNRLLKLGRGFLPEGTFAKQMIERHMSSGYTIINESNAKVKQLNSLSPTPSLYSTVASYFEKNISVWSDNGSSLYGLVPGLDILDLGSISSHYTMLPETIGVQAPYIQMAGYEKTSWNKLHTVNNLQYSPSSGNTVHGGQWSPNIAYQEPGNALMMYPGLYYRLGNSYRGAIGEDGATDQPASEIAVQFLCLIDTRSLRPMGYTCGYCELLTDIDDEEYLTLNIFAKNNGPLSVGASWEWWTISYGVFWASTTTHGRESTANIELDDYFLGHNPDSIKCYGWSTEANPTPPDAYISSADTFGYVVHTESEAALIYMNTFIQNGSYADYTSVIYNTRNYVSHSVSHEGRYVAFFLSDSGSGTIDRVVVYDMAYRKTEGTDLRTDPPYKKISDSTVMSGVKAEDGIVIASELLPAEITNVVDEEGNEISQLFTEDNQPKRSVGSTYVPDSEIDNAMGGVFWTYPHDGRPLWMWKISCADGIHAFGTQYSSGECIDAGLTLVRSGEDGYNEPASLTVGEHTTSGDTVNAAFGNPAYLMANGAQRSFKAPLSVRMEWVDEGDPKRPVPRPVDASGSNVEATRYDELRDISIGRWVSGKFNIENVVGTLTVGDCIDPDSYEETGEWLPDTDCEYRYKCRGLIPYSATSSCGQTGLREEEFEYAEMVIYGDINSYGDGAEYWVIGGGGEFVWETQAEFEFVIEDNTYKIRLTDTSGCCGMQDLKVTDRCGSEVEIECRAILGVWVVIEDSGDEAYWNYRDKPYAILRDVTDSTITHTYMQPLGTEYSPEYSFGGAECKPTDWSSWGSGTHGCGHNYTICGYTNPLTPLTDIPNFYDLNLGLYASGCTVIFIDNHIGSYAVGWNKWSSVSGTKVWEWQCP